jgi:hypothetical protein
MHRYILQPYNGRGSRFLCPNCRDSRHSFKRYIDTQTQTYLADHVGKCDRIDSCGYHYPPRMYFAGNGTNGGMPLLAAPLTGKVFNTLPYSLVDDTAKAYQHNNFVKFLTLCFGEHTAFRLALLYKIGTSKHWPGAAIFWQIDVKGCVRTGKIMLYNPADGHRVKQPYNHIAWAHALISQKSEVKSQKLGLAQGYQLKQCFFGEHLISTHPYKIIAICESEKTAVICSFFYPEYIWLAAGSLEGLSLSKCKILKNRRVILYPDVNGFDKWKLKAREMNLRIPTATFTVDKTLEQTATPDERTKGIDLADRWIDQLLNKTP